MTRRLKRAVALRARALRTLNSPGELLAFARIFLLALLFSFALRLKLSKPLLNRLRSMQAGPAPAQASHLALITRRTDTVLLLGRPLIRSECLTRSCLLYYQMRRAGADVDIRFGVATREAKLRYHCWVLVSGRPDYEYSDPTSAYQPLYDLSDEPVLRSETP